jgi:hypothetical protein
MTHTEATKMVLGKRNKGERKIGNNTYAYIEHDSVDMVESHVDDLNTLSGHKYNKFVQDEKCLIITRGK